MCLTCLTLTATSLQLGSLIDHHYPLFFLPRELIPSYGHVPHRQDHPSMDRKQWPLKVGWPELAVVDDGYHQPWWTWLANSYLNDWLVVVD